MAIDGDLAVVGASAYGTFDDAGAVYSYHREDPQNTPSNPADDVWMPETPELRATVPGLGDWFGYAVSISGNWHAVGELRDGDAPTIGAVHMFERVTGLWEWRQKLKAWDEPSAQGEFGASVDLDGDRLVVGAPLHGDCNGCGATYVFSLSSGTWVQEQRLVAIEAAEGDEFGTDAAIFGDRIVVGAHQDDNVVTDAGAAYVFQWDGTQWVDLTKLTKPESDVPGFQDGFGRFVAISGDLVVVGPPYDDGCGVDSGSTYVFDVSGAACDDTPLSCPDCNTNGIADQCDISSGLSQDCQPNAVPDECELTSEVAKLVPNDTTEYIQFGHPAIDGNTIVVAAGGDDSACLEPPDCDSGAAYVFEELGDTWVQTQKLKGSKAGPFDSLGPVAISGDRILCAAQGYDPAHLPEDFTRLGTVYVFRHEPEGWIEEQMITSPELASNPV